MLAKRRERRHQKKIAKLHADAAHYVERYEEQIRECLAEMNLGETRHRWPRCYIAPSLPERELRAELRRLSGADPFGDWEVALRCRVARNMPSYRVADPARGHIERCLSDGRFSSVIRAEARAVEQAAAAKRQREAEARRELRQIAMRRTHSHVRRARELEAHGEHSTREWELKLAEFGGCCAYCGAEGDMHRDHFVPISRGGSNYIANIVPACATCNLSKGAKTGAEFLAWLRQRPLHGAA